MRSLFEVTIDDIEHLNDVKLTDLMSRLLFLEADSHKLPDCLIHVSLKTDVPDGGEDGRIEWKDGPTHTKNIPSRLSIWQCKATVIEPADCKQEILAATNKLKPQVEKVLDVNGTYVLFYYKALNRQQIDNRIVKFREALTEAGKAYAATAKILIIDANQIVAWVNTHIAAITAVHSFVGKPIPLSAITWEWWSGYQAFVKFKFVQSDIRKSHAQTVRTHLSKPQRVARIVGLSGLGKTRLALEIFRPSDAPSEGSTKALSNSVIYIDAEEVTDILPFITSLAQRRLSGIVVIDNCPLLLHRRLEKEVGHIGSELKLLTLNYDPDLGGITNTIRLVPETNDVIQGMLTQAYPNLRTNDLTRITDFAQGFPQMAVLMADAHFTPEDNVAELKDSDLLKRLLWGRKSVDPVGQNVISVCALFNKFNWKQGEAEDYRFIATVAGVAPTQCYSAIQVFISQGVLESHRDDLAVAPRPLALRLAAEWIKNTPVVNVLKLIVDMPQNMQLAFCDQFARLDFSPEAQSIANSLCAENGLLSNPSTLKSITGLQLLSAVAEVNPAATLSSIERVLQNPQDLFATIASQGIDSLILTFEKLCFRKTTFANTTLLMMSLVSHLAGLTKEKVKTRFLQLFYVNNSGTEQAPQERLDVIKKALSMPLECQLIGIEALGCALASTSPPRTPGAEFQGSGRVLQEWQPKPEDAPQVLNYRKEALKKLIEIINAPVAQAAHRECACQTILSRLPDLAAVGLVDELPPVITVLGPLLKRTREILERLRSVLGHVPAEHAAYLPLQALCRKIETEITAAETPLAPSLFLGVFTPAAVPTSLLVPAPAPTTTRPAPPTDPGVEPTAKRPRPGGSPEGDS